MKDSETNKTKEKSIQCKRFRFEWSVIIPCTLLIFIFFIFSACFPQTFFIDLPESMGGVLVGILGGIFGCIIAVLTFCMAIDYGKNENGITSAESEITTADSKAWFIDTIRLGIIGMFFSVAFYIGENMLGIVVVFVIMMLQQFVVFHYYFKNIFDAKRKAKEFSCTESKAEEQRSKESESHSRTWVKIIFKCVRWLMVILSIVPICFYIGSGWAWLVFVPIAWLMVAHMFYFDENFNSLFRRNK